MWEYIGKCEEPEIMLTYEEIEKICGVPIDHSFLTYKKELSGYGYAVKKISMKNKTEISKKDFCVTLGQKCGLTVCGFLS